MNKFIIFILLLICVTPVYSDQISIMTENDVINKTDNFYTHGTRIQYMGDNSMGFSCGQNMYTPTDKLNPYLIPDDRPYSGYLYASVFDTFYLDNGDEFFAELQMGTTGPNSYAEQTQIWVHEHIHSKLPMGWANQIPNHFAFLLIDRYTTHFCESKYFSIDPYIGSQVGNLADNLNAGFNVYAGYNLPPNRNSHRVIPFKGIKTIDWNPYAYLYFGLEPKIVMYNMLLEDPRFTIHPETYVYDRNAGLVLGCKYFELAFTFCLRSREFDEQPEPEKFGSAKISFNF